MGAGKISPGPGWSQTHPLPAMTHEVSQSQARTITTVLVSPAAVGTYVILRLLELFKARMWKSFVFGVQEKLSAERSSRGHSGGTLKTAMLREVQTVEQEMFKELGYRPFVWDSDQESGFILFTP